MRSAFSIQIVTDADLVGFWLIFLQAIQIALKVVQGDSFSCIPALQADAGQHTGHVR